MHFLIGGSTLMLKDEKNINKSIIFFGGIAAVFIIVYLTVLTFTYSKTQQTAEDSLLHATATAKITVASAIDADVRQTNNLTRELSGILSNASSDEYCDILKKLHKNVVSSSFNKVTLLIDDHYYSSTGKSGIVDKVKEEEIKKYLEQEIFAYDGELNNNEQTVVMVRDIKLNDNKTCYVVCLYEHSEILNNCYSDKYYAENGTNLFFTNDGNFIFAPDNKNNVFTNESNIFSAIEKYKVNNNPPRKEIYDEFTASVTTIEVNGLKYAVTYTQSQNPQYDFDIARIVPTKDLFSITGNLLSTIFIASVIFFFVIITLAYRFFKATKSTSEKIKNIAYTDPLTGYANFAKFKEDGKEMLKNASPGEYYMACADIVGFRYINDAFGYDMGDQILIEITKNIAELLNEGEIFSRISGDKFVILTKRDLSETDNELFIYKLTERISTIGPLAKSHIRLEIQMGIYKIQPNDIEELSLNAMYDRCLIALYSIEHSDTGIAVYDSSIYNEQLEKKNIESRMHEALQNGEFRVYVQPKYRTSNGKLAAGEALIRWVDPEKGLIPPVKFIPLFEQNRFVHDVDLYVMEVVARFLRMRLNEGLPVVPISLNISPVEITMPNFKESYISIKDKYDIPDKLIELEFTEGIFFDDEKYFQEIIKDFQNHGFTCSIDDFGSGYSSLNILKSLPVDTLKLDRIFFKESDNIARDRSVVRSVVSMARALNIKTVAEGVETIETVDFLKLIGCTLIQGYIYSKPLPLTEFEERLNTENIDTNDELDLDFDKFEAIPLDVPLTNSIDSSLRSTYTAICEINTNGNIYHIYYPNESTENIIEKIPERGFYTSFVNDLIPKFLHPKDLDAVIAKMNPISLVEHFKNNKELDFECRHMRLNGSYSWLKVHIIKASGGRADSQVFFAYFNIIDNYKETEQKLEAFQNRFASAYSSFNGVIFEIDPETELCEKLESHSDTLAIFKNGTNYEEARAFINENLTHPDYKEKISAVVSIENVKSYFAVTKNIPLVVELLAKPSRKSEKYHSYVASFTMQANNKILLTIQDNTEEKTLQALDILKKKITDRALSNVYDRIIHIILDKDQFEMCEYVTISRTPKITEGKYSTFLNSRILKGAPEEDRETLYNLFSLETLKKLWNSDSSNHITFTYQVGDPSNPDKYQWNEVLIITEKLSFGDEQHVYLFIRSIEEQKEIERTLNEYAHRLSYSLAMYEYAYSVQIETEEIDLIGGLSLDNEFYNEEDLSYTRITNLIKNKIISEEDRMAFRRLTYLDNLLEYFSHGPATLVKYFSAEGEPNKVIEISIIYGSREQKITFYIRKLDRKTLSKEAIYSNENEASPETVSEIPLVTEESDEKNIEEKDLEYENLKSAKSSISEQITRRLEEIRKELN